VTSTIKHRATEHGPNCPQWCEDGPQCNGLDCGESPASMHFVARGGYGLLGVSRALVAARPMSCISYYGRPVGSADPDTEVQFFFSPEQTLELVANLLASLPPSTEYASADLQGALRPLGLTLGDFAAAV
jgi:hypothetical protein